MKQLKTLAMVISLSTILCGTNVAYAGITKNEIEKARMVIEMQNANSPEEVQGILYRMGELHNKIIAEKNEVWEDLENSEDFNSDFEQVEEYNIREDKKVEDKSESYEESYETEDEDDGDTDGAVIEQVTEDNAGAWIDLENPEDFDDNLEQVEGNIINNNEQEDSDRVLNELDVYIEELTEANKKIKNADEYTKYCNEKMVKNLEKCEDLCQMYQILQEEENLETDNDDDSEDETTAEMVNYIDTCIEQLREVDQRIQKEAKNAEDDKEEIIANLEKCEKMCQDWKN